MYDKFSLDDFSGGLNKQVRDFHLPPNQFRSGLNLRVDKGSLRLVGGMQNVFTTRTHQVMGFTPFTKSDGTEFLVYGVFNDGFYSYNRTSGVHTLLQADVAITAPQFVRYGNSLYVFDRGDAPRVWTGTGSLRPVGVTAPSSILLVATQSPGGNLDNSITGATAQYQYQYTREDDRGIESDPSPLSVGVDAVNQKNNLQIPAYTPATGEGISWVNLYRKGAGVGTPLYVDRVAFSPGVVLTYTDNTADEDLGLKPVPANNTKPPNLAIAFLHDNRIFGAEYQSSRLYYSGVGSPEYYPVASTDPGLYGGILDIDDVFDNWIIGLASTGSVLIVGRMRSVHAVMWTGTGYRAHEISNVGIFSPRSIIRCGDEVLWLSRDLTVNRFTNDGVVEVSLPLRDALRSVNSLLTFNITGIDLPCAAYHEGKYVLILPTGNGGASDCKAYSLDLTSGVWEELSSPLYAGNDIKSVQRTGGNRPELIISPQGWYGVTSTYTDISGSTYFGLVRILADEISSTLSIDYLTDKIHMGQPRRRKRLQHIIIYGTITQGVPAVALTVTIDGVSSTIPLSASGTTLLDTDVSNGWSGYEFQFRLTGKCSALEIQEIIIQFSYLEESWK